MAAKKKAQQKKSTLAMGSEGSLKKRERIKGDKTLPLNLRSGIGRIDSMEEEDRTLSLNFGTYLYFLRCAKRATQESVAEELGVTQSTLSRIERGKQSVTVDLFGKAARLFGLEPPELMALCAVEDPPSDVLAEASGVFGSILKSESPLVKN